MVTAVDGRTLTFAEWGDLGGFPVFNLHGTPGSRFPRHCDESVFVEVGARVISYDRPGYGGSDRDRGRQVVDCVADVTAIANTLGVERFAVIGGSGGGPHCLAVAARLPERVTRATCVVGIAPYGTVDFDWFDGMEPLSVKEWGWALAGEDVLAPELEREAAEELERVTADPSKPDVIRQSVSEAFRQGVSGWVDDSLCFTQPWGFDVSEIRIPTRVNYGLADVLVPWRHGEWLARNVPDAEAVIEERGGHKLGPDVIAEAYGWLVQPV